MIEILSFYDIIFYFIIYSFLGWVMESTFKSLLYKKWINSGFLNGPFIPIYGVGGLVIISLFTPFKDSIFLLFLIGFVGLTAVEYVTGYLMEKIFNTSWWDYTGNFMNINGKVCLENSIYWGILSIILTKYLNPFIIESVDKIPRHYGEIFLVVFIIYFFIDYTLTMIEVLDIQERAKQFMMIKDNSILLATTTKIGDLKKYLVKKSKRLLTTFPKLTYLKLNKKLKDIIGEPKILSDKNNMKYKKKEKMERK